ncbi:MAG: glycosyltransferase family 4 protein [Polyangiaceae bacterium]
MLASGLLASGALCATAFFLSLAGCVVVQRVARRLQLVDLPNQRSLHQVPVPRLGGVAIVSSVGAVLALGARLGPVAVLGGADLRAWLAGAAAIAVLGFVDDVRPLPAVARLVVQVGVTTVVLGAVLGGGELGVAAGLRLPLARSWVLPCAVLFVVGTTNIYNFMDGMDGLAATQTMSAGVALAAASAASGQVDVALVALVIAAACAGFFVHNAPPATIFLGDAGSTSLGFTFGTLAFVAAARPSPVPIGVVPVALAPFLLDGAFTILRRVRRGERVWQAHRSHLYQRAVASGLTHRNVLVVYAAWCAVSTTAALQVARSDATATLVAVLAALLPLGLTWKWVVRRERARPTPSE